MVERSFHTTDIRPGRNPFSEREFLDAWWSHLGKDRPSALPEIFDGGVLIRTHALGPRIVEMAGSGAADMLAPGDWTERPEALADFLRAACGGDLGEALHIRRLDRAAPTGTLLVELAQAAGYTTSSAPYDVAPYAVLPDEWSDFQQRRSKKTWSQLRRKGRRLGDFGDVEIDIIQDHQALSGAIEDVFRVYKARSETVYRGPLWLSDTGQGFLRAWMERLAASGQLDLSVLRINRDPIAFVFGVRSEQAFYLYATAFDPRHPAARFRPGEVLVADVLQRVHATGVRWFDFLLGAESYKYEWTDRDRPIDSIIIARDPGIARLLSASQAGRSALRHAVRHVPLRLRKTIRGVI